ncbi:MAG TPA: type II toxin-antitoxin system RelE/ParE family toxin [Casimicrobiaceae bacterium]
MIRSFRHKGLERYLLKGTKSGIHPQHEQRLGPILGRLQVSLGPRDMNLPGLALHPVAGPRKGTWAVSISGNRRVTFGFVDRDAFDIDYEDYH